MTEGSVHHKAFDGAVVQLVRTPACHAGGRGFKSLPSRHLILSALSCFEYSAFQVMGMPKGMPVERSEYAAIAQ